MLSASFAPVPSEVTAARHFAENAGDDLGCVPEDLALIVSELASNAYRHAHSRFTVSLRREDDHVLVEVADTDPSPVVVIPGSGGTSGRGMYIVAAIAAKWGTRPHPEGKTVWATLDC
jgi:anti-sigma regulatory factor (Ser/Thr protein kinase)